jgi:KaiC/GvpD/RAD55 family RecA-like ATPase
VGKTIFCKQFLYNGLVAGEPGIYVAMDESPNDIFRSMKRFGFDTEAATKNGLLRIVDCYSWKLRGASPGEYSVSNPAELAPILGAVEKAMGDSKNVRLVFDSITGLSSICSHSPIEFSKFLQVVVGKIRTTGSNAIFTVAPEAHDLQFMSFLRQAFDGTLEMKDDESGKEIKRLLRIFSLKGAKHRTSWSPFEITNNGIVLKSDSELRCVMCSRLIEWEPHIEVIEGKEYTFDSSDCAITYRKFKSLYGEYFE